MAAAIIAIHLIVCALLIALILIQRGRGGGLVESFSGVESVFGTKTNEFLARITTVLAIIFFMTCIGLAVLSAKRGKSLMHGAAPARVQQPVPVAPAQTPAPAEDSPLQVPPTAPAQPAGK